jgi:hypothetical protein
MMKRSLITVSLAAGLAMVGGTAAAAGFPTFPARRCAAACSSSVRLPARSRWVTLRRIFSRRGSSAFAALANADGRGRML